MPEWAGYLVGAWYALVNDRTPNEMGACSGIYYASISAYASDHGLSGAEFDDFYLFLRAMDDEYVTICGERAKEAMDRAKQKPET
jgi:hypothetical protein